MRFYRRFWDRKVCTLAASIKREKPRTGSREGPHITQEPGLAGYMFSDVERTITEPGTEPQAETQAEEPEAAQTCGEDGAGAQIKGFRPHSRSPEIGSCVGGHDNVVRRPLPVPCGR